MVQTTVYRRPPKLRLFEGAGKIAPLPQVTIAKLRSSGDLLPVPVLKVYREVDILPEDQTRGPGARYIHRSNKERYSE